MAEANSKVATKFIQQPQGRVLIVLAWVVGPPLGPVTIAKLRVPDKDMATGSWDPV